MFADDLVLLSESAEGLQKCIDKLDDYCSMWGLSVNIDKTKVIIFNKGGKRYCRHKFKIRGMDIEIVNKYCYLGIIFSASGSFTNACDALFDKALKAFYKFKQLHPQNNAKLAARLFDALVVPILTYAGVVWGPLYAHKISTDNFFTTCNDSPIERLNVKLCKYLLGVHKKSTNNAVRGELGRYPLLINVLENSVRYYTRILNASSDSLVKLSCSDREICLYEKSWISIISKLRATFGQNTMKAHMLDLYKENWESLMNSFSNDPDSKLRTYAKYKKYFCTENYVLQFPQSIRRNLTKLRISAHTLAIETGRYTKPLKTPIVKRTCFHCNQIEDEFHLIFNCELYAAERSKLSETLQECTTLNVYPSIDAFNSIMSCLNGDAEVGRAVCDYINSCFTIRSQALSERKEKMAYLRPECTITQRGRHSIRPARLDL